MIKSWSWLAIWKEAGLMRRLAYALVLIICLISFSAAQRTWGGCPPFLDRNNPENYGYSFWPRNNDEKHAEKIILPADFRMTAQNEGKTAYVYWGEGGFSWAIPYFVGLAALAWGVDDALTLEEIYRLAESTKTRTSKGRYVVNPRDFIKEVKKRVAFSR
jgi:hypothetical protein